MSDVVEAVTEFVTMDLVQNYLPYHYNFDSMLDYLPSLFGVLCGQHANIKLMGEVTHSGNQPPDQNLGFDNSSQRSWDSKSNGYPCSFLHCGYDENFANTKCMGKSIFVNA